MVKIFYKNKKIKFQKIKKKNIAYLLSYNKQCNWNQMKRDKARAISFSVSFYARTIIF